MRACKGCGNPLVLSMDGHCRSCGRMAGSVDQLLGTKTLTQPGGERLVRKMALKMRGKQAAKYARRLSATSNHLATPVASWQAAEVLVRDWMQEHGHKDAALTRVGADGGVDIRSATAVVQVKNHVKTVPIAEVQRLYGIARAESKTGYFFSSGGYTPKAMAWADEHFMPCFTFSPVRPANPAAVKAMKKRLWR